MVGQRASLSALVIRLVDELPGSSANWADLPSRKHSGHKKCGMGGSRAAAVGMTPSAHSGANPGFQIAKASFAAAPIAAACGGPMMRWLAGLMIRAKSALGRSPVIRWLPRLTIRAKLALGMGALNALLVLLSAIFFVSSSRSDRLVDDLAREGRQNVAATLIQAEFFNARMMIWRALANGESLYWDDGDIKLAATVGELSRLVQATQDDQRK